MKNRMRQSRVSQRHKMLTSVLLACQVRPRSIKYTFLVTAN